MAKVQIKSEKLTPGKRGRPQKFAGKVDINNLDMNIFSEDYTAEGKLVYKMYTAVVWAVSLGCEVRVVLVDYEDAEKKRQTRKVFFSTDTSMSARDIFDIYRTRFHLEFVFYDKHIIMQSRRQSYIDFQDVNHITSRFNFA